MTKNEMWVRFLKTSGKGPETTFKNSFRLGMDEKTSNKLLDSVINGEKRGAASCFPCYQLRNEKPPVPGDYHIILDWNKNPRAVIRTESVLVMPFVSVKQELVDRGGEGMSLEEWRTTHRRFFMEESKKAGFEFDENTPIVFEVFDLVYVEDEYNRA